MIMGIFSRRKTIVTHSGDFHADDIFSVAALLSLPEYEKAKVVRSREADVIGRGNIVVDVGAVYDPSRLRFDHHQKGGAGTRDTGIPYSAFGLVWKAFGERICGSKEIALALDVRLVAQIDACDNAFPINTNLFPGIREYTLDDIAGAFKPTWQEEHYDEDAVFLELVSLAQKLLEREIARARARLDAAVFVEEAYAKADDKRLIVLSGYYPWKDVLVAHPEPLFVVSPRPVKGQWSVRAVPRTVSGFENRKNLPKAWAGLREEELARASGVDDASFCHNTLYFAVANSKEGALALAKLALQD